MQSDSALGGGTSITVWLLSHLPLLIVNGVQDTASCHLYTENSHEYFFLLKNDFYKGV